MAEYFEVSGTATVLGKKVDRAGGMFQLEILPGAFDQFLSGDRGDNVMNQDVILTTDHMIQAHTILAREGKGTLIFDMNKNDKYKLLVMASIRQDELATNAQTDIVNSLKQGNLSELSVGLIPIRFSWNLEDEAKPVYEVIEAGLRELSLLPYGAMGKEAKFNMKSSESLELGSDMVSLRVYDSTNNSLELSDDSLIKSLELAREEKNKELIQEKEQQANLIDDILADVKDVI